MLPGSDDRLTTAPFSSVFGTPGHANPIVALAPRLASHLLQRLRELH